MMTLCSGMAERLETRSSKACELSGLQEAGNCPMSEQGGDDFLPHPSREEMTFWEKARPHFWFLIPINPITAYCTIDVARSLMKAYVNMEVMEQSWSASI